MTIGKARQSTVFFGTGRKPIGLHGLQHLSEYMACLGSPRVISTRLLQRCRAISRPPAAKLGGAPSWRLQFHRDPAKARDEQKRKGLNTHKQTKQLFFLGKSLYFMIKPNLNKKRFQPTENWEFFPHEIEGFTKNRDLLMKPLGKSGKNRDWHTRFTNFGWMMKCPGKTAWFVGQRIVANISERRYPYPL